MELAEYIKKMNDYCPLCGGDMELDECDCSDSTDILDSVWSNTGSLGAKTRAEANRGLLID